MSKHGQRESLRVAEFTEINRRIYSPNIYVILKASFEMKGFLKRTGGGCSGWRFLNSPLSAAICGLPARLLQLINYHSSNLSAIKLWVALLQTLAPVTANAIGLADAAILCQLLQPSADEDLTFKVIALMKELVRNNAQVRERLLQAGVLPNIFRFVDATLPRQDVDELLTIIHLLTGGTYRPNCRDYVAECLPGLRKMFYSGAHDTMLAALTASVFLIVPQSEQYGYETLAHLHEEPPEKNGTIQAFIEINWVDQIAICLGCDFDTGDLLVATLRLVDVLATGSLEQVDNLLSQVGVVNRLVKVAAQNTNPVALKLVVSIIARLLVRAMEPRRDLLLNSSFITLLLAYSISSVTGAGLHNPVAMIALSNAALIANSDQLNDLYKGNVIWPLMRMLLVPEPHVVTRALLALGKFLQANKPEYARPIMAEEGYSLIARISREDENQDTRVAANLCLELLPFPLDYEC